MVMQAECKPMAQDAEAHSDRKASSRIAALRNVVAQVSKHPGQQVLFLYFALWLSTKSLIKCCWRNQTVLN